MTLQPLILGEFRAISAFTRIYYNIKKLIENFKKLYLKTRPYDFDETWQKSSLSI